MNRIVKICFQRFIFFSLSFIIFSSLAGLAIHSGSNVRLSSVEVSDFDTSSNNVNVDENNHYDLCRRQQQQQQQLHSSSSPNAQFQNQSHILVSWKLIFCQIYFTDIV
jgi:hypothetical protein